LPKVTAAGLVPRVREPTEVVMTTAEDMVAVPPLRVSVPTVVSTRPATSRVGSGATPVICARGTRMVMARTGAGATPGSPPWAETVTWLIGKTSVGDCPSPDPVPVGLARARLGVRPAAVLLPAEPAAVPIRVGVSPTPMALAAEMGRTRTGIRPTPVTPPWFDVTPGLMVEVCPGGGAGGNREDQHRGDGQTGDESTGESAEHPGDA
jgi:hypothetical protein